jgi:2-polyprenyl-3-methyl-5-hydroxy-6-metoxy-1,4-benzoquinol methylase
MNWKEYWQQQGTVDDPFLQVGRKGGQQVQEAARLAEYAAWIAGQLELTGDDVLLDVCCGNGMFTQYLASHCKAVVGVDFSQSLIDHANAHYASDNIRFICADALRLSSLDLPAGGPFMPGFTKATLCFSFQYFESAEQGRSVVEQIMQRLLPGGKLFLGDVPDRERWFVFYHSVRKIMRLIKQMAQQRNDMGKFWSEDELGIIARSLGLQGKKLVQPAHFPYAHYRMDYLLCKGTGS